jgi:hypothetical protein
MAKKPAHELPDPPEPDQELPPDPPRHRPKKPDQELPEPEEETPAPKLVGRVHFEDVSGGDNGAANYAVPMALRERTLVWRHKQHEQSYVNDQGHWVYRQTHTAAAGALERDADLEPIDETPDA